MIICIRMKAHRVSILVKVTHHPLNLLLLFWHIQEEFYYDITTNLAVRFLLSVCVCVCVCGLMVAKQVIWARTFSISLLHMHRHIVLIYLYTWISCCFSILLPMPSPPSYIVIIIIHRAYIRHASAQLRFSSILFFSLLLYFFVCVCVCVGLSNAMIIVILRFIWHLIICWEIAVLRIKELWCHIPEDYNMYIYVYITIIINNNDAWRMSVYLKAQKMGTEI